LVVIDAAKHLTQTEYDMLNKAKQLSDDNPDLTMILILNKVDLVHPKTKLLTLSNLIVHQ
jgi:GTPase Era involved in 16S rRNA processing